MFNYFIVKHTIFEWAQFNPLIQKQGEFANKFTTKLYAFTDLLHDELFRDNIVDGIADQNLSKKLQLH